jgi:ribosomal protein L29
LSHDVASDYHADFYAWTREQADLARRGSVNALDMGNIAEELEGMGRAERRALASQLERLMAHLLKWRYQPQRRSRSWRRSIRDSRRQIARLLADSPSLGSEVPALIVSEWLPAVRWASDETGISRRAFPADCPWTVTELLDPDVLPDNHR